MTNIGKPLKVTEEPAPIKAPRILPREVPPERKRLDPLEPFYVPVPVRRVAPKEVPREIPREVWDVLTTEEEPTNCPRCGNLLEDVEKYRKVVGLGCSRHGMVLRL